MLPSLPKIQSKVDLIYSSTYHIDYIISGINIYIYEGSKIRKRYNNKYHITFV